MLQMFLELQPKIKNWQMFLKLLKIKNCLPCPALAALPCPAFALALFVTENNGRVSTLAALPCPMSLNKQTPHFLRLETKRYGFFLGYGFQDLDRQINKQTDIVALIY